MSRKKKVFLTILSIVFLLILSVALYANYWMDNLVAELNAQLTSENIPTLQEKDVPGHSTIATTNDSIKKIQESEAQEKDTSNTAQPQNQSIDRPKSQEDNHPPETKPSNLEIATSVQQQIDRPIEKADLLTAGLVVLRKLSSNEINFLFGFSDQNYTKEELIEVRRILLDKLNDHEIQTLRALAQKYGKKLDILDPNVPIR